MESRSYAWLAGCFSTNHPMAYLNVKERRLEAKIAYVGALASGRTTNFEHLGEARITDEQLALYWQPKADIAFRDCSVRVEMVASRGEPSAESVRNLVRSADGVVFVADADPAAHARNEAMLALLREALAEITHPVPVVVQFNKSDLAGTAKSDLAIADWPHVEASAISGVGVAETAERAVESVMESLRRRDIGETPMSAKTPSVEANPLLTALRQLLRETVASYVEETEKKSLPLLEQIIATQTKHTQEIAKMRANLAVVTETVAALGDTAEGITLEMARSEREQQNALREQLVMLREQAAALKEHQAAVAAVKRGLDAIPVDMVKEIRQLDARKDVSGIKTDVERTGRHVIEQLTVRFIELDGKTTAIGETYNALIEELKKPKKSWFGG